MNTFSRFFLVLISLPLLTACAGSAYKLPAVNDADVKTMQQKIADNNEPLVVYERSDKKNKQLVANIASRLAKNAKPLCTYAEYKSCYFQVEYNPGNEINAYASENYKITVYRGLLQYLKNNDEIAAVIAHEMGHHLANHNEEKQQNASAGAAISGILTAVVLAAANNNNPYYNSYQQQQDQKTLEDMMHVGAKVGALSYSKEQEREADLLATYLLSRAKYDLKKAGNIMVVLSKSSGEGSLSRSAFLDTHPAGVERVVAWQESIDEINHNPSKLPYLSKK